MRENIVGFLTCAGVIVPLVAGERVVDFVKEIRWNVSRRYIVVIFHVHFVVFTDMYAGF